MDSCFCTAYQAPFECDWIVPGARGAAYWIDADVFGLAGRRDADSVRVTAAD